MAPEIQKFSGDWGEFWDKWLRRAVGHAEGVSTSAAERQVRQLGELSPDPRLTIVKGIKPADTSHFSAWIVAPGWLHRIALDTDADRFTCDSTPIAEIVNIATEHGAGNMFEFRAALRSGGEITWTMPSGSDLEESRLMIELAEELHREWSTG